MNHRLKNLALLLWLIPLAWVQGQSARFVGEDLQVTISDSLCRMSGTYSFENPSEEALSTRLFYPFYLDQELPFPVSYSVVSGERRDPLAVSIHPGGISFPLDLQPGQQQSIQVRYDQVTRARKFIYILTSTQVWGTPLKHARYEIRMPQHLQLENCSLNIDSETSTGDFHIYRIEEQEFLPSQEFIIQWGLNHEK